jgi:hypothetical protein
LAKLLGVVLLLAPVPTRLKEWAYAGFAIDLGSALIAHLSVGDGPEAWGWAAATGVLWGLSYFFWRRLQATRGETSFPGRPAAEMTSAGAPNSGKREGLPILHRRAVLGHRGPHERLERARVDLLAFLDVDRPSRVAFQAGVEEA